MASPHPYHQNLHVTQTARKKLFAQSAQAAFLVSFRSSREHIFCQYGLTEETWHQFSLLLIFSELGPVTFSTTNTRFLKAEVLCEGPESHSGSAPYPPSGAPMSCNVNCQQVHTKELHVSGIIVILKWWICITNFSHRYFNPWMDSARSKSHTAKIHWSK